MSLTLNEGAKPALLDGNAASLARELAQGIRPPLVILEEYGFSGPDDPNWLELSRTPEFQRLLESLTREWNSADTTQRRVRIKAQASMELALVDLHAMMTSERLDPKARLEAFKVMKDVAGFSAPSGVSGSGEGGGGTSIKIIIGGDTITKQVQAGPPTIDSEAEDA